MSPDNTVQTTFGPSGISIPKQHRRRVHTVSCGRAKGKKCVCVCKGQRHKELLKKKLDEKRTTMESAVEGDDERMTSLEQFLVTE